MKTDENKAKDGGPSGARSRDLRIKRPRSISLICLRCGGDFEPGYTREPRANCWVIRSGSERGSGQYLWSTMGFDDYCAGGFRTHTHGDWGRLAGALTYSDRHGAVRDARKVNGRVVRLTTKAGGAK